VVDRNSTNPSNNNTAINIMDASCPVLVYSETGSRYREKTFPVLGNVTGLTPVTGRPLRQGGMLEVYLQ